MSVLFREREFFKISPEIAFLHDDAITVRILDNKNHEEYNRETYSVSNLAIKLLQEVGGWSETAHANGWHFFTAGGITLSGLQDQIESQSKDQ